MKTVLVVDDDLTIAHAFSGLLRHAGYAVLEAHSAKEALHAVTVVLPDLLLLDICMPGMDGVSLALEFRKAPELKSVPILFVTAYAASEISAKVTAAVDVLAPARVARKPLRADELQSEVEAALALTESG